MRCLCLCLGLPAALGACTVDVSVPAGARIECGDANDCPTGLSCSPVLGICVEPAIEGEAPRATDVEISPAVANAADLIVVAFNVSGELARLPSIVLTTPVRTELDPTDPTGGSMFAFSAPAASVPEGTWNVQVTLVDTAGRQTLDQVVGQVVVDTTPPELAGAIDVDTPVVGVGGTAAFTVAVSEPLAEPPGVELSWLGGTKADADGVDEASSTSYDVTYAARGAEPSTPTTVTVVMEDMAGNAAQVVVPGVLVFDQQGPQVIAGLAQLSLTPGPGNPRSAVARVTNGTLVELFLAFDEAVVADGSTTYPVVATIGAGAVAFSATQQAGTTYLFELDFDSAGGANPDGRYDVQVVARDAIGNLSTVVLDDLRPDPDDSGGRLPFEDRLHFTVDTMPPASLAAAGSREVVHVREPWGTDASVGIPRSRVVIQPGVAEGCSSDEPLCPEVSVWSQLAGEFALLGTSAVASDGSLDYVFSAGDFDRVYLTIADTAGNQSDSGVPRLVTQGQWHATYGGKVSGSVTTNPHKIVRWLDTEAGARSRHEFQSELLDYSGADLIDGSYAVVTAPLFWREWSNSAPSTSVLYAALACHTAREVCVIVGGEHFSGGGSNYNPSDLLLIDADGWRDFGSGLARPSPRSQSAVAYDPRREKIVLYGGAEVTDGSERTTYGDLWEFDGDAWQLRCDGIPAADVCATDPGPRRQAAIGYDQASGRIIMFGGFTSTSGSSYSNATWAWDGVAWMQVKTPAALTPRARLSMAPDATGRLVLYGGTSSGGTLGEMWWFEDNAWVRNAAGDSTPIADSRLVYDARRSVTVLVANTSHWEWDGNSWNVNDIMPGSGGFVASHALAYDAPSGRILAYGGGYNAADPFYQSDLFWAWDGTSWTQRGPLGSVPGDAATMAWDAASRRFLIVQGAATWLFDGYEFTQYGGTTPGAPPQGRPSVAPYLGGVLLWGGSTGGETWWWSGAAWYNLAPVTTPSPRADVGLASDQRRQRVVMFGGKLIGTSGSASMVQQTWEFGLHGASICAGGQSYCWRLRSTSGPPPRRAAQIAYDARRGVTVMFSGTANSYSSGGDESIDDLWEWNGAGWTSIAMGATRPIDRHYGAFTYDPFHGVSVLFGGEERGGFGASDQIYGDHWTWNGDVWSTMPTESVGVRFIANGAGALAVSEYGEQLSVGPDGIYQWRAGGGRTSAVLAFDWSRAAVPAADIRAAQLFARGQSRGGPPTADGSPTGGLEAAAWSWRDDRWVSTVRGPLVGDNDVQVALPASGAQAATTTNDTILFRLRADYPAGTVPAGGIALDYAELTVDYWLGTPGVCGDGFVDAQERCDDGDTLASGNGCGTSCERLGSCGDEIRQDLFEECDQGIRNSDVAADACRSDCRQAYCGDGVKDAAEDCDDGNAVDDGDGCGGDCRWSDRCGDGRVTQNEECDDGNSVDDHNGCLADCTLDPCCSTNPSGGCAPGGSASIEACVETIDASCAGDWTTTCVAEVLAFSCGVCNWTP